MSRFYPACRGCIYADDHAGFSPRMQSRLAQAQLPIAGVCHWHTEGLGGVCHNQMNPHLARRAGSALGMWLRRTQSDPQVILGDDGRALAAELVAAACEGLRLTGCDVAMVSPATSASLLWAMHELGSHGALWIGNAVGQVHTVGLRFWGPGGKPMSTPGMLDGLRAEYDADFDRPVRRSGQQKRYVVGERYAAGLQLLFHALRPLRVGLRTASRPLWRHLKKLAEPVACEFRCYGPDEEVKADSGLHFTMTIDGDGEVCQLQDERGNEVAGEAFWGLLARYWLRARPGATVVAENGTDPALISRIQAAGAKVHLSDASSEAMDDTIRNTGAGFAGGPSGRYWFHSDYPSPDGLQTLATLLQILSQSDRPLSQVVADALEA